MSIGESRRAASQSSSSSFHVAARLLPTTSELTWQRLSQIKATPSRLQLSIQGTSEASLCVQTQLRAVLTRSSPLLPRRMQGKPYTCVPSSLGLPMLSQVLARTVDNMFCLTCGEGTHLRL